MTEQPGLWALEGVQRQGGNLLVPGPFHKTDQGLVMRVWTCPHCKLTRLYAIDEGE
jgi:hypothetical protein